MRIMLRTAACRFLWNWQGHTSIQVLVISTDRGAFGDAMLSVPPYPRSSDNGEQAMTLRTYRLYVLAFVIGSGACLLGWSLLRGAIDVPQPVPVMRPTIHIDLPATPDLEPSNAWSKS
jgi:hypothetical protein